MGFAHRIWFEPRTYVKEHKKLSISWGPNGTGAVANVRGIGATVARTDVGEFTVTLDDKWVELVSAIATMQLATAADQVVQVGTYDASAKTIIVNIWDISSAALADVAADADNRVNLDLHFKNTKVPR